MQRMTNTTARLLEKHKQVALLNAQVLGGPVANPFDAMLARIDLELANLAAVKPEAK